MQPASSLGSPGWAFSSALEPSGSFFCSAACERVQLVRRDGRDASTLYGREGVCVPLWARRCRYEASTPTGAGGTPVSTLSRWQPCKVTTCWYFCQKSPRPRPPSCARGHFCKVAALFHAAGGTSCVVTSRFTCGVSGFRGLTRGEIPENDGCLYNAGPLRDGRREPQTQTQTQTQTLINPTPLLTSPPRIPLSRGREGSTG